MNKVKFTGQEQLVWLKSWKVGLQPPQVERVGQLEQYWTPQGTQVALEPFPCWIVVAGHTQVLLALMMKVLSTQAQVEFDPDILGTRLLAQEEHTFGD